MKHIALSTLLYHGERYLSRYPVYIPDQAVFQHPCFSGGEEDRIVKLYRKSHYHWEHGHMIIAKIYYLIIRIIYTCQIHPSAEIGTPAHFGHGLGMVIGCFSKIGNRVNLTHNITIAAGTIIGDNFFMGPGAVIIKQVTIGNNVMIGANAVVTTNIPDNTIATGIPSTFKEND
jgi:serine O-acetyltransferase